MKAAVKRLILCALVSGQSSLLLAQGPQIQAWTTHPTDVLWFINAKNTTSRVVSIDGGTLSDCVEVTNCDGSGFVHGVLLKPGDSAHVGDVNRAICTNPTDSDGNEIHECEKRPPTTFKFQVFANWAPAKSASNSSENAHASARGLVRASYLKPGAGFAGGGAEPSGGQNSSSGTANNVNDITNWIKDRMAEEASAGVNKHYEVEADWKIRPGYRTWDLEHPMSGVWDLKHQQVAHDFTISGCKVSYKVTDSSVGTETITSSAGTRTSNTHETNSNSIVEFDLSAIQPGSISLSSDEDPWASGTTPLSSDSNVTVTRVRSLCANEGGCAITHVRFGSVGEAIKITDLMKNTYSMSHSVWYPVSSAALAQRLVNAWRDAAKACGGKDLNKSLY